VSDAGAVAGPTDAPAVEPSAPRLQALTEGRAFEGTVVLLTCLFAAAAYFDAWTYVNTTSGRSLLEPWQDAALHFSWFLLTAYLATVMAVNVRRGLPVTRSLPPGYGWSFVGCVGFSAMVLLDRWAQLALGAETGLSALLSPARVGEIAAGALMVTGPLRAAWRRQDERAGLAAIVAAALLLSTVSFVTQFAHPFRDPWAAGSGPSPAAYYWVSEDLGVASLVLQGLAFAATFLLLIRRFQIRFGSFTLICLINGALVAPLKGHWNMLLVAAVTGIVADAAYAWLKPSASNPTRLRTFAFLVPATFAATFFVVIAIAQGSWWPSHVWSGAILVTGLGGFLISYLAYTPGGRQGAAQPSSSLRPARWPEITANSIKEALEALPTRSQLAASPLCRLPYLGRDGGDAVAELEELLKDAARELSTSKELRDAQAGHLLVEYYVKRSGTHEQIAERLHMSRPAYYRRLQRGCELLAERLEKLAAFTETG
jgi:hypothetical protein